MTKQPTIEFIQQAIEWWKEFPKSRHIEVKSDDQQGIMVWFYDYNLMSGAYAVDTIPDLEALHKEGQRKKFEELQKIFKPGSKDV